MTWKTGIVIKILKDTVLLQELAVQLSNGEIEKAIHYTEWIGRVEIGDQLLINTTAVSLSLGSGGFHFVISKRRLQDEPLVGQKDIGNGHIMKMRYTPLQFAVQGAEEETSPYHPVFQKVNLQGLKGIPVLIGELHSMLPALCLRLKFLVEQEGGTLPKVCYIMTDSASLPLAYSQNVAHLKEKGLLASTITIGQAFGGDLECVNIFSALHAAITICGAEIIIITPGPGVVGTGTPLGFGGMEQVFLLQGVSLLGGKGIFLPRVSFSDGRSRHYGISHHSLTVLQFAQDIPLSLHLANNPLLLQQLSHVSPYHEIILYNQQRDYLKGIPREALALLKTMGRNFHEDTPFFLHIFYAMDYAWTFLKKRQTGKEELKLEEKTIASRTIYDGKVIQVRVDEVALPNGKTASREIVHHNGAVAILAVTDEERIVLVRQFRKALERFLVEVPAGKLEGEEEPVDCAKRELMEETGFLTEQVSLVTSFYTSPGFADEKVYLFEAKQLTPGPAQPDEDEFVEVLYLTLEEAKEMIEKGEICDAKTILGIYAWELEQTKGRG